MSETRFIQSIHRKLPKAVYRWKINDNLTNGVPDAYYSGDKGDLWVEYKYIGELPVKDCTQIRTCLTEQQIHWLNAREKEGRRVALIIGSPQGSVIIDTFFDRTLSKDEFTRIARNTDSVIHYIKGIVLG